MNRTTPFALLTNGNALRWADLPEWPLPEFLRNVGDELGRGERLSSLFGVPEDGLPAAPGTAQAGALRLVAVLAFDAGNTLAVGRSRPFSGSFPSLTATHSQAHLFEREIWEQHGVRPESHPWLKAVRQDHGAGPAMGDFFRVDGREIHEVAVGPVHAGIIEPGHFRFQCAGEEVLHLEIALGYQHRGIEEALAGGPHRATVYQMETAAGDTTIGHATAYASALEALAGSE
ncbi:MAG: NADH-quinone oxidoreductase subunit C, partial [Verrucomicrobia bacterium]|nr:NADH-quinone oxidoreductase subunit C [Verrucomicrobiota bacterium]